MRRGAWPVSKYCATGSGSRLSVEGQEIDVEMLTDAGAEAMHEGRIDGTERAERGREIGDRAADPRGRLTRHAGERHQPAHALRDRVVAGTPGVGARLPESGDRGVDNAGVCRADRLIAQAKPVSHSRQKVLHDDVGAAGELEGQPGALRVLQLDGDPTLATVDGRERGAHAVAAQPGAHIVASTRALELDHVSPGVRPWGPECGGGEYP